LNARLKRAVVCVFLLAALPVIASARTHGYGRRDRHPHYRSSNGSRAERDYISREPLPLAVRCSYRVRDSRGRYIRCSAARAAFERDNPCPSTGQPRGACPGYVVDHIVPLKRGGADLPSNMQWQTVEDAKDKDKIE